MKYAACITDLFKLDCISVGKNFPEKIKIIFTAILLAAALPLWATPDDDLSKALSKGNIDEIRNALKQGANPNLANKDGRTLLMWESVMGRLTNVKLLVEHGADVNVIAKEGTALMHATIFDSREVVKYLLSKGANVNARAPRDEGMFGRTSEGDTALIRASRKGNTEIVRILISHGANVNLVAESSFKKGEHSYGTALTWAGNSEIADMLKAAGGKDIRTPPGSETRIAEDPLNQILESEARAALDYLNMVRANPSAFSKEIGVDLKDIKPRPPLVWDERLARSARKKALDMIKRKYFAHVDPDGIGPNYLVRQEGYVLPKWWPDETKVNNIESLSSGTVVNTGKQHIINLINDEGASNSKAGHRIQLLVLNEFYASHIHAGIALIYNPNSPNKYYFVIHTGEPGVEK